VSSVTAPSRVNLFRDGVTTRAPTELLEAKVAQAIALCRAVPIGLDTVLS